MRSRLFITKPLELLLQEAADTEHGLKRTLSALDLTMLGVGAIIGAGIFVLTGQAAASYAGPAIVLSFVLSGIACAFAGLCYAEMASVIPIAGRDHRGISGLDHRLGSDFGVHLRGRHGFRGLVRVRGQFPEGFGNPYPARAGGGALRV